MGDVRVKIEAEDDLSPAVLKAIESLKRFEASTKSAFGNVTKATESAAKSTQQLNEKIETTQGLSVGLKKLGNEAKSVETDFAFFGGASVGLFALEKTFGILTIAVQKTSAAAAAFSNRAAAISPDIGKVGAALRGTSLDTASMMRFMDVAKQSLNGFAASASQAIAQGLTPLKNALGSTAGALKAINTVTLQAGAMAVSLGKVAVQSVTSFAKYETGLAGLVSKLGLASAATGILAIHMLKSDSIIGKLAGVGLLALTAALGGAIFLIQHALVAVGGLIVALGTGLVNAATAQIQSFEKAEIKTLAFTQTIVAMAASAEEGSNSLQKWNTFLGEMSSKTGETQANLQVITAEFIGATKALGFTDDVQKRLISSTVDVASKFKLNLVDAAQQVLGVINGNSQSFLALNLHMKDSEVGASKAGGAFKDTFSKMEDGNKTAVRTNVLFEKLGKTGTTGFAIAAADTYSRSLEIQKNAQDQLNSELGRGARLIEGQVIFGLAEATRWFTEMTKPLLPLVGFLEALFGRLLQGVGTIAQHAVQISLLIAVYKTLQTVLGGKFFQELITKQIPVMNKSFVQLASQLGATNVSFKSLGDVGKSSLQIVKAQAVGAIGGLTGVKVAGQSAMRAMMAITSAAAPWLAIAAAVFILVKAVQFIEEETGIFSEIWGQLVGVFNETSAALSFLGPIFQRIANLFQGALSGSIRIVAGLLTSLASGFIVFALTAAKATNALAGLAGKTLIAKETIQSLEQAYLKTNEAAGKFAAQGIANVGSGIAGTFKTADRALASNQDAWKNSTAAVTKAVEEQKKKVDELKKVLGAFGGVGGQAELTAQLQMVQITEDEKRKIIVDGQKSGTIDAKLAQDGLLAIRRESITKQLELEAAFAQQKADILAKDVQSGGDSPETALQSKFAAQAAAESANQARAAQFRGQEITAQQAHDQALTALAAQGITQRTVIEQSLMQQRADLLGISDAGLQEKLAQEEERFQLELEQTKMRSEQILLTDAEKKTAIEEAELNHQANMETIKQENLEKDIQRNETLGNNNAAFMKRLELSQRKHGAVMGTLKAAQASAEFGALQQGLGAASELMASENKTQFKIGKAAATSQALINTFLAATGAFASLSSIPIVGPFLAIAAAAAITAAGMLRVKQIKNTPLPGGQADDGMTEIPKSLTGRSFIMDGGERVIKSRQNKDLTEALSKINSGDSNKTNNISINVQGNATQDTVRDIRETIIDVIRQESERGKPVISSRGVTG